MVDYCNCIVLYIVAYCSFDFCVPFNSVHTHAREKRQQQQISDDNKKKQLFYTVFCPNYNNVSIVVLLWGIIQLVVPILE
mmetsp:Transcript_13165/g.32126  ORF Transcript_13165/g.32126 Transcript_13165/m.32126 type:complete len:80 (-) Transcript_13165:81-320(-)